MSHLTDDFVALLARARLGDDQAVSHLVERYEGIVRRAAHGMLGPAMRPQLDSMDVVQSVRRGLSFGGVQQLSLSDSVLSAAGSVGIRATAGATLDNFSAS